MATKKNTPRKSTKKKKKIVAKAPVDRTVSRADYLKILIRLTERNIKENSDETCFFRQQADRLKKELETL